MGIYVATLGRNPTVVLLGYFTALQYARDTLGSDQVLDQVYLLPETAQVKDSNETQRLCDAFRQVGRLSVHVLDAPSGFPETEAALKKLSLESDLRIFLNYTGGRKYLSLGALKYASESGWYGFSLNSYDRLGFSALFQCAPKDTKLERFAIQPLPLGVLLDLNGIEILSSPKEEHLTWWQSNGGTANAIWVKLEDQQYAVIQDQERVFVCDPTPIPSADKKPEFARRQNHARQIGDLLAVPVYCPLEEADVKDYSTYISALEKEHGVVFDSNFDKTIARFRQRQHLESDLELHSPKLPLHSGKVLIVLISDQPMNAYAPILTHQPSQVYLLTTPEKSRVAQNIQQTLASAERDIQVCSWLDSSNPATTADLVRQILVLCEGRNVILNANGLTTSMSASAFLVALKNPHVDIEYLDWGNLLKLSGEKITVDWRDKSQAPLQQMQTVFSLHGFEFSSLFQPEEPLVDLAVYSLAARANPSNKPEYQAFKQWWHENQYPNFSSGSKNEYRLYCDLRASLIGTDALVFPESKIQPQSGGDPLTPDAVVFFQGKVVIFDAKDTFEKALAPTSAEEDEQAVKPELVAGHFTSGVIVVNSHNLEAMPQNIIDAIKNITSQTRRSVTLATRDTPLDNSKILEFPKCLNSNKLFPGTTPRKLSELKSDQLKSLASRA